MAQTKRRSSSRTRSSSRPAELIAATEVIESAPHITETKDDAAQTLAQQDSDTLSFFYTPHTITALVLMLIAFLYNAVYTTASTDFATNSKMGLVAMMVTFSLIGLLMFPDGNFIRPHPAAWRIVLSSSAIYQLILVWILFQNVDDVRQLLRYVDPSLGLQLPERSYADNCELSYANVMEQMDEFVVAHVLGWVAKGIMLRDYWILWILSIMFEVLEYSLQHQLPNFAECWWDHWILDVSICNLLGLWLGMQYNYYMSLKEYSWRGFKQIPSVGGKVKRAVQQFTPYSWTKFDWALTKDLPHFLMSLTVISVFLLAELNAFYLKYLLWIPPTNPLNTYRLLFFFISGSAALNEGHAYISTEGTRKLGAQAWLTVANIFTEFVICLKFGKNEFHEPTPWHVVVFWTLFLLLLFSYALYQFLFKPWYQQKEKNDSAKKVK